MENKFVDLIEEAKKKLDATKNNTDDIFSLTVTELHQKLLEAQEKNLSMLEDLFFDYTMENLNQGMIEVDELHKKYNGGTDHE